MITTGTPGRALLADWQRETARLSMQGHRNMGPKRMCYTHMTHRDTALSQTERAREIERERHNWKLHTHDTQRHSTIARARANTHTHTHTQAHLGVTLVVMPAVPGLFAHHVNHIDFVEISCHEPAEHTPTHHVSRTCAARMHALNSNEALSPCTCVHVHVYDTFHPKPPLNPKP